MGPSSTLLRISPSFLILGLILPRPALADFDADGDESFALGGFDCDDRNASVDGFDDDGDGYSPCDGDCDDDNVSNAPDRSPTSGFIRGCSAVITAGATGEWNERQAVQPSLVNDGTTWRLYYRGHYQASLNAFGVATSTDGITWTQYASNPVLSPAATGSWDEFGLASPAVIYDPDDPSAPWKLYYHAKSLLDGSRSIGLATSTDGYAFTRYGTSPVVMHGTAGSYDDVSAHAPAVTLVDGLYHMYYSAKSAANVYSIVHAVSIDNGYTWTKDPSPVFFTDPLGSFDTVRVSHPWVAPLGDGMQFLYSGSTNSDFLAIGGGTSDDAAGDWIRDMADPYLWDGDAGIFDQASVYSGQLMVTRAGEVMYFSGLDGAGDSSNGGIGRATNWTPAIRVTQVPALLHGRDVTLTGTVYDTGPEDATVEILDHRGRVIGWGNPTASGSFSVTVHDFHGYKLWTVQVVDKGGLQKRKDIKFTLAP